MSEADLEALIPMVRAVDPGRRTRRVPFGKTEDHILLGGVQISWDYVANQQAQMTTRLDVVGEECLLKPSPALDEASEGSGRSTSLNEVMEAIATRGKVLSSTSKRRGSSHASASADDDGDDSSSSSARDDLEYLYCERLRSPSCSSGIDNEEDPIAGGSSERQQSVPEIESWYILDSLSLFTHARRSPTFKQFLVEKLQPRAIFRQRRIGLDQFLSESEFRYLSQSFDYFRLSDLAARYNSGNKQEMIFGVICDGRIKMTLEYQGKDDELSNLDSHISSVALRRRGSAKKGGSGVLDVLPETKTATASKPPPVSVTYEMSSNQIVGEAHVFLDCASTTARMEVVEDGVAIGLSASAWFMFIQHVASDRTQRLLLERAENREDFAKARQTFPCLRQCRDGALKVLLDSVQTEFCAVGRRLQRLDAGMVYFVRYGTLVFTQESELDESDDESDDDGDHDDGDTAEDRNTSGGNGDDGEEPSVSKKISDDGTSASRGRKDSSSFGGRAYSRSSSSVAAGGKAPSRGVRVQSPSAWEKKLLVSGKQVRPGEIINREAVLRHVLAPKNKRSSNDADDDDGSSARTWSFTALTSVGGLTTGSSHGSNLIFGSLTGGSSASSVATTSSGALIWKVPAQLLQSLLDRDSIFAADFEILSANLVNASGSPRVPSSSMSSIVAATAARSSMTTNSDGSDDDAPISFAAVMNHPIALGHFRRYLVSIHAQENIDFYWAARYFPLTSQEVIDDMRARWANLSASPPSDSGRTKEENRDRLVSILKEYVVNGAPNQININSETFKQLNAVADDSSESDKRVLNAAMNEVYGILATDSFPKFMNAKDDLFNQMIRDVVAGEMDLNSSHRSSPLLSNGRTASSAWAYRSLNGISHSMSGNLTPKLGMKKLSSGNQDNAGFGNVKRNSLV